MHLFVSIAGALFFVLVMTVTDVNKINIIIILLFIGVNIRPKNYLDQF